MTAPNGPGRPDLEAAIMDLQPGDEAAFDALLADVLTYQRAYNPVVSAFESVGALVPVAVFRETRVACFDPSEEEAVFLSSGTGSGRRARHGVRSLSWYDRVCAAGFDRAFPDGPFAVAGHLPHYSDESSLVRMVRQLALRADAGCEQVRLFDASSLREAASRAAERRTPFLLIGAAFGLLDLVSAGPIELPGDVRVVETGGMKTHRREWARDALHARLAAGFLLPEERIGSEYGMCELTSQAWAFPGAWYEPPPWMRVRVVDPEHPERILPNGTPGLLLVEDLANLYTASRVLTEDLGVADGHRFTVTGRLHGSPLRGCNLLLEA